MESTKKFLIVAAFCLTLASWCASFAIKWPCQLVPATLAPAAHDPHANRRVHRCVAQLQHSFPFVAHQPASTRRKSGMVSVPRDLVGPTRYRPATGRERK